MSHRKSYEDTDVPVSRSQDGIRQMIYAHKGTAVSFMSQPPREGFEALITLQDTGYHIRVTATCKDTKTQEGRAREERRVWRVLFYHLKAMFVSVDSGVIAVEDVILPYIVTPDNRTISEHIAPRLKELPTMEHGKLLSAGGLR